MPKINHEEYEVLKELDDKWKWIARNYNGALITYTDKPMKNRNLYWDSFGERMEDRLFQFIQWEDESPYNIAELIEEYEKDYKGSWEHAIEFSGEVFGESEEKEVKDLEWLKRSIDKRIKTIESDDITFVGSEYYDEGYIDGMRDVLYRIDQLDEPEVLSQELPVIPKFVADWIKEMKQEERPLYSVMSTLMNKTNHEWSVWKSANKNFSEVVAQAWLNGYEIEPEPQYRLKAGENYLYFNLDGTVRGSTKKNAAITKERLEELPFDVEMAVLSGIIEVEELKEC